jgi:adenylate cyclase
MGDNVNLASRLEGLNKEYGTHILISEATLLSARRAGGADCVVVRELDAVRVKGKKEPVRLFELRGKGAAPAGDRPLLDAYAEGLALYRGQKFAEAREAFGRALSHAPGDGPSELLLRRSEAMAGEPPGSGWDGVFKMEHK